MEHFPSQTAQKTFCLTNQSLLVCSFVAQGDVLDRVSKILCFHFQINRGQLRRGLNCMHRSEYIRRIDASNPSRGLYTKDWWSNTLIKD